MVAGAFFFAKRKKDLSRFAPLSNFSTLSSVKLSSHKIKYALVLAAMAFIILAIARPQYGDKPVQVKKEYSEIVAALDISKSMLAQDIAPSRLERAKMILTRVIEENQGEKMGVIVFAGTAMWQCPMTFDTEALKMFFNDIQTAALPMGGTQISDAVNLAVKSVEGTSAKNKVLLLVSDGEDHDSKIKEAAAKAKSSGLRIIAVGIGTQDGAPILLKNSIGQNLDYVKDRKGNVVMSRLNGKLLKMLADETGGKYLEASNNKDISQVLIDAVKGVEKNKDGTVERHAKRDRFQIFLFAAFVLLIIALLTPRGKK